MNLGGWRNGECLGGVKGNHNQNILCKKSIYNKKSRFVLKLLKLKLKYKKCTQSNAGKKMKPSSKVTQGYGECLQEEMEAGQ